MSKLVVTLVLLASAVAAADPPTPPTPDAIVEAADRARNPQQAFRMTLALVDYEHARVRDRIVLAVHTKLDKGSGQFRNVVRYVEPPRDAGKLVLLDASKMWFYDPASKTSVRISAQQRLTGQASNGDVLTVNLARDYRAKLVGEETLKDADHTDRRTWHLDLTAATSEAIYSRLEFWVEVDTFRAIKAKFYSDSGRVLKIAYYRKFAEVLGGMRPTETVIIDAVDASLLTTVTATDFAARDIPDAWFQRDYLPRIEAE